MTKEQAFTRYLFWAAFGVFLAVSIPHIAWVFRQYEPQDTNLLVDGFWWVLAYGFAIAIDAVIAWLSHAGSSGESKSDKAFTWGFIGALVVMSWYYNWVFSIAHDPSNPNAGKQVWTFILIDRIGIIPQVTVGGFTPVIISALPLFIIAYTFILGKVNAMKMAAAKSVEELEQEAQEAERRAEAQRRIQAAYNQPKSQGTTEQVVKNAFGFIKVLKSEAGQLAGQKRDPEGEKQDKVMRLFRDTPTLLSDENAELAETAIMELLHLKRPASARFWRLKVSQIFAEETAKIRMETGPIDGQETDEHGPFEGQENGAEGDASGGSSSDDLTHEEPTLSDEHEEYGDQETEKTRIVTGVFPESPTDEDGTLGSLWSRRYVSFNDAAILTGYSIDTLKRKVRDGEIRLHSTDKNRVLVSSLRGIKNKKRVEKSPILTAIGGH